MSYYYCYKLGYKKNNKIYPLFPFRDDGTWADVITRSRSYDNHLHDDFNAINKDMLSDEMIKQLLKDVSLYGESEEDYIDKVVPYIKWLPLDQLPADEYLKSGYYLISDVERYESESKDTRSVFDMDLFYDQMSTTAYNARLHNVLMVGDDSEKDEDGDYIKRPITDYMFYVYPDYDCKEYDSFLLKTMARMCDTYHMDKDTEIVVIDMEG